MGTVIREELADFLNCRFKERSIFPLITLRIAFGTVMFISIIRFCLKGWIETLYLTPKFFFNYYGFEWIKPLPAAGMYLMFGTMAISALFIAVGFLYRWSAVIFFLTFTYVELIDKTIYLNHYYFISLLAFLMIFVPAGRNFSVDTLLQFSSKLSRVPSWTADIFRWQLCIVYLFAGLAKINSDWLLEAMPLRLWLPPHATVPLIGPLLSKVWVAYFFSWFGAFYDLLIWIFLLLPKTRSIAYFFVILFHVVTAIFFQIGMFPYIMILMTLIFFSDRFHENIYKTFTDSNNNIILPSVSNTRFILWIIVPYFAVQILLPWRYLLYPGNLFWTEEGFRFSWRVMLMEKAGTAFFYIRDRSSGREFQIDNSEFLTPVQEKMMATQPDMILQYAQILKGHFESRGIKDMEVRAECYVTVNGKGSKLLIDPRVNLLSQEENLRHKGWLLSYHQK